MNREGKEMTENRNMKLDVEIMVKASGGQLTSEDGYIGEGIITARDEPGYYVLQDDYTQWYALYSGSGILEVGTR